MNFIKYLQWLYKGRNLAMLTPICRTGHHCVPYRVSFRGGAFTLLGFCLPPVRNFVLKVNQFKCFETFNSCTMHKVLYVYATILLVFLLHIPIIISKSLSVNNEWMSFLLYYSTIHVSMKWYHTVYMGTSLTPCIECAMQVS